MGRINISKAITSPRLPTSFENVDLYHVQALRLITRVNHSCNNCLSQHYDTLILRVCFLSGKTIPRFPCPFNRTGVEEAPAFLQGCFFFSARIYLLSSCSRGFHPALLLPLGARRHPWVAHHP